MGSAELVTRNFAIVGPAKHHLLDALSRTPIRKGSPVLPAGPTDGQSFICDTSECSAYMFSNHPPVMISESVLPIKSKGSDNETLLGDGKQLQSRNVHHSEKRGTN